MEDENLSDDCFELKIIQEFCEDTPEKILARNKSYRKRIFELEQQVKDLEKIIAKIIFLASGK